MARGNRHAASITAEGFSSRSEIVTTGDQDRSDYRRFQVMEQVNSRRGLAGVAQTLVGFGWQQALDRLLRITELAGCLLVCTARRRG